VFAATALPLGGAPAFAELPTGDPRPTTGDEALAELLRGNRRYVRGRVENPRRDSVRRVQQAEGQRPYAIILGCADSRVPPEVVFDEGIGDLFVVRVAGNTAADPLVVGSIQYSVLTFESVLLMVLGHDQCGAVKSAIEVVTKGTELPGDLPDVVAPIVPAVESVRGVPEDELLDAAIDANIKMTTQALEQDSVLAESVSAGNLKIVGAEYTLKSGKVRVLR
jgi:carbonic anhydrase